MTEVADAWVGLREVHKTLVRGLDAELEARHGLTLSSLEVLGRLAAAEGKCLQPSELASATGLSRSRITRICDALQARGLVERVRRADDSRGVDARLTAAGAALVPDAQATHLHYVEERFFGQLSAAERATLAEVFGRLAPGAAPACAADAHRERA